MPGDWICCQLGAREHYAVARALAGQGSLSGLITEAWVDRGSLWARCSPRLAQRFHLDLASLNVRSFTGRSLLFESAARLRGLNGWDLILARNRWFQRHALQALESLNTRLDSSLSDAPVPQHTALRVQDPCPKPPLSAFQHVSVSASPPTLFAYSYAARDLFRWAKARGWRTVLGQIDAGPALQAIIKDLNLHHPGWQSAREAPPAAYWQDWREECALADQIMVNSQWVQDALVRDGIPPTKLAVVPLAYDPPAKCAGFQRTYPERFTRERPLRVLFVGQVTLLKGIAEILAAARLLAAEPVEWVLVGPVLADLPKELRQLPNLRWIGSVPRSATMTHYRAADLFLFPSHGDGFGLVQLEAQAWGLPVVASRHCGDVVVDGVNGALLTEVSGPAIATILRRVLANPQLLRDWAAHSRVEDRFTLPAIAEQLLNF